MLLILLLERRNAAFGKVIAVFHAVIAIYFRDLVSDVRSFLLYVTVSPNLDQTGVAGLTNIDLFQQNIVSLADLERFGSPPLCPDVLKI